MSVSWEKLLSHPVAHEPSWYAPYKRVLVVKLISKHDIIMSASIPMPSGMCRNSYNILKGLLRYASCYIARLNLIGQLRSSHEAINEKS